MTIPAARTPHPDPERFRVALASIEAPTASDGGWQFRATAQVYNRVNDRLMVFRPGSGAKTIAERVPAGRVKIHDGHPWNPAASQTVGKVLAAEESDAGVTYTGFISGSEEAIATKLSEGVVDENSIEILVMREDVAEVDLEDVPEAARPWAQITPAGLAKVREIQEWMWFAIGLVSGSSQGVPAILEPPTFVPYQDLPVAALATSWDPDGAAARLQEWAGVNQAGAGERWARLQRAFLCRGGAPEGPGFEFQIADVLEGELVVVPEALEAALRNLEARIVSTDSVATRATLLAAARHVGRYEARLTSSLTNAPAVVQTAAVNSPAEVGAPATPPTTDAGHELPPTAGPATPPTDTDGSTTVDLEHAARAERLRGLQTDLADLRLPNERSPHDPTGQRQQPL